MQDGHLIAEMEPVRADVLLHHSPAEHVGVGGSISLKYVVTLALNGGMVVLVKSVLDEIEQLLALLLGQDGLGKVLVEQICDRHDLLRLVCWGKEAERAAFRPVVWHAVLCLIIAVAI